MPGERQRDLVTLCGAVDRVLGLVRDRLPEIEQPAIRDWNDRLFVEAFARAFRCLQSVREMASRREAEDAAVLTRALLSLALQYLWLARVDDEAERHDRLRRLHRKWATERASLGEELEDLGHFPTDASAEQLRATVAQFRAKADELERDCVRRMPGECDIAKRLDRDLEPELPRWFELLYTRIYRPTSHVAHYGIGSAVSGLTERSANASEWIVLERFDEPAAAEALGLALVTYATLLDVAEPIIPHGLSEEIAEIVRAAHAA
jgi:hypothetical protein